MSEIKVLNIRTKNQTNMPKKSYSKICFITDFLISDPHSGNMFSEKTVIKLYQTVIPQILEKTGFPKHAKTHWSQTAGSPDGSAPGFIIHSNKQIDIIVDVVIS